MAVGVEHRLAYPQMVCRLIPQHNTEVGTKERTSLPGQQEMGSERQRMPCVRRAATYLLQEAEADVVHLTPGKYLPITAACTPLCPWV